jgi:hypothetical protein
MKAKYIQSGNAHYALNFKAASSSLVRAIITAHYPEILDHIYNNITYTAGSTPENKRFHYKLPKTENPEGEVILIVRDPVERFRSACSETGKTPDEALTEQVQMNNHFWPTSRLLVDGCKLYRFESDLDEAATALGLTLPLPNIDGGSSEKPTLTPEQLTQVQAIYADDITLFESISSAGQVYIATPVPATDDQKAAKITEIAQARYKAEISGTMIDPFGLIPTDRTTHTKLTAVYVKALNDSTYTKRWKVGTTTWVTLDAATIIAIGDAVEDHVQAQFDKEQALTEAALSATTVEELIAINW